MYTNQATDTAQGLLARLSTLTFRIAKLIAANFRITKLEHVNYFRVQWVKNIDIDLACVISCQDHDMMTYDTLWQPYTAPTLLSVTCNTILQMTKSCQGMRLDCVHLLHTK